MKSTVIKRSDPEFVMLVGIPASGKSTYAADLKDKGYTVCSSDEIRRELYGKEEEQGDPKDVFKIMADRSRKALRAGKSVVYDATNVKRKDRMHVLGEELKNVRCRKKCVLFVVPVDECRKRNAARGRSVPDYVYGKMLRSFQMPGLYEGWDEIEFVWYDGKIDVSFLDEKMLDAFDQETHWHTATLGDHMKTAGEYAVSHSASERAAFAASIHDIGKVFTKEHKDTHGNYSKDAHYYGHENYGAYLTLLMRDWEKVENIDDDFSDEDWIYIAELVNWHMAPLNKWAENEKAKNKDRNLIGEEMYQDIMTVNEADVHAK